jgi:hypothetical protein
MGESNLGVSETDVDEESLCRKCPIPFGPTITQSLMDTKKIGIKSGRIGMRYALLHQNQA